MAARKLCLLLMKLWPFKALTLLSAWNVRFGS
jgi:hypothetical protein